MNKLRYRFDNLMAQGSKPLLMGLLFVFLAAFGLLTVLRIIAVNVIGVGPVERGDEPLRQMYLTFLEITDPGSMTQDVESGTPVKIFAVISGMVGLVLLSALIAFITTALDERLRELRRGRSTVVAEDHTVLLGWNERIADIVRELILANESEKSATVVILADRSKEDMDEFLTSEIPERLTTTIVTRRGNPAVLADLALASLCTCKSVIVLADCSVTAPPSRQQDSDISVIKRVLAAFASAGGDTFDAPIICEVFRAAERAVLENLGPGQIIALDSSDILAKILVQTSRSVGLSAVYEEVLSFDGCEMYVYDEGAWGDMTFGAASFHFPDGVALGVLRADAVMLNPCTDLELLAEDSLLVLASDDSALAFPPTAVVNRTNPTLRGGALQPAPERILIIGWTPKVPTIIAEYDDYLEGGSEILVVSRAALDIQADVDGLQAQLQNITLSVSQCDPLNIDHLAELDPASFDQALLLSQGRNGGGDEHTTDSETILILLLLRQLLADTDSDTKLITEILESSHSALVRHVGGHDFIVSNQLVSTIASQLSEDPALRGVFDTLFSEEGSEFYLKPIEYYAEPGDWSFGALMELAQQRSEVAIGVRHAAERANQGVTLIPNKRETITMAAGDSLVVLAEDER